MLKCSKTLNSLQTLQILTSKGGQAGVCVVAASQTHRLQNLANGQLVEYIIFFEHSLWGDSFCHGGFCIFQQIELFYINLKSIDVLQSKTIIIDFTYLFSVCLLGELFSFCCVSLSIHHTCLCILKVLMMGIYQSVEP